MEQQQRAWRVGVDIGGTFTDLVAVARDGSVVVGKAPSTTADYTLGIKQALQDVAARTTLATADVAAIVHGTTVASNAILERRGAVTGLITTRGFRDVLEIRRLRVPRLYDMTWEKPPPLVPRLLRVEVDERIDAHGRIVRPLKADSVLAAIQLLVAEGVEAIAVCLLNSYANPVHEMAVADEVRRLAPNVFLSASYQVLPEIREYDRTSTTVINAYIMPVVLGYVTRMETMFRELGVTAPLAIMQSNGGLMSTASAANRPAAMVESGPAAGVVAARELARLTGLDNLITVDIGGTTAKAATIEQGEFSRAAEYEVGGGIIAGARLLRGAGYLLRMPSIDLAEVGAGGGSHLWLDRAGSLQVGPRSSGAVPGPVCYDQGGSVATVTDANVVLGYINPTALAGGAVRLRAALALQAIDAQVAAPLGLSLEQAAYGAHVLAASSMIRAIRAVSSERGRDPRDFTLCVFGGNGPVFGAAMAGALEIQSVLVPPLPGLFSAVGLLAGELEHHAARSLLLPLAALTADHLAAAVAELEAEVLAAFAADGLAPDTVRLFHGADLRYQGQSFELHVPLVDASQPEAAIAALGEHFGQEHARTYGHRAGVDEPVELVTLRLVGRVPRTGPPSSVVAMAGASRPVTDRRAYFGPELGWCITPVVDRAAVPTVATPGPLIVEEYDATTVVPPGAQVRRDEFDNLLLRLLL